jgi:hypothetical protein
MIWSVMVVYEADDYVDALDVAAKLSNAVFPHAAYLDGPPAERAPLVQIEEEPE